MLPAQIEFRLHTLLTETHCIESYDFGPVSQKVVDLARHWLEKLPPDSLSDMTIGITFSDGVLCDWHHKQREFSLEFQDDNQIEFSAWNREDESWLDGLLSDNPEHAERQIEALFDWMYQRTDTLEMPEVH